MHLAILFEFSSLNGGEHSMLAVLDELRASAFRFTAIAPPRGPLAEALHERRIHQVAYNVRDEHGRRRTQKELIQELRRLAKQLDIDLLHANSLSMGRLTGALSREFDTPCTAHLRDIISLSAAAVGDLNGNSALVAVSQATRQFHVQRGLSAERSTVVYNGVDCRRFQPRKSRAIHELLGLPTEATIVLNVGQICLRKRQSTLAAAAVLARNRLPSTHYVLVGERHSQKAESVEFERRLTTTFQEAGLGERLHFLGTRDDVPRLMNAADVLVHTAHQEPFGRVLLEAAASGLPILATNVGGTSEMLRHDADAWLVPSNQPDAVAEGMCRLHHDVGLRDRLAKSARERVLENFSIKKAADELLRFWERVIRSQ